MDVRREHEELCRLVRTGILVTRDFFGGPAEPPAWLADEAPEFRDGDLDEVLSLIEFDDQAAVVAYFIEASQTPGRHAPIEVRLFDGTTWGECLFHAWNLLDDPDVVALVCVVVLTDDVREPGTSRPLEPTHQTMGWFQYVVGADRVSMIDFEGDYLEVLGYTRDELVGRRAMEFAHPDDVIDSVAAWIHVAGEPGRKATSQGRWRRRDGGFVWIERTMINRTRPGGDNDILTIAWDLTERRAQDQAMRRLADDFRLLADEVPAAVFRCDADGTVTFHNARWNQLVAAEGHVRTLAHAFRPDAAERIAFELAAVTNESSQDTRGFEVGAADGRRVFAVRLRSIPDEDADHRRIVGSIEDVTATAELRHRARHDPLTHLLNREAIDEHLAAAVAGAGEGTLVVFVDLNGFKTVNDTFGHGAGDDVLVEVAGRLAASVRPQDHIGRYGGDEFVVVCHDVPTPYESTAEAIVGRLRLAMGSPITLPGGSWQPAASFGWAPVGADDTAAAVLRRADEAMYAAKRSRSASSSRQG